MASFTSPGGIQPFIEKEMESFYYNRTELIAPTDGSLSAILILKELVCDDAGEYQCLVDYVFDKTNYESTSPSTVAFKGKIIYMYIMPVYLHPGKFYSYISSQSSFVSYRQWNIYGAEF